MARARCRLHYLHPRTSTLAVLTGYTLIAAGVASGTDAALTGIKVGVGLAVAAGNFPNVLGIPGDPIADNFFSEMRVVHGDHRERSG